ncbi:MAG: UDP-3-O-(3-hydroxymyristoyl)glucosamine N-acyltransferase [Bacteroidales bacterium]|nr:UDP-3-O-(3-hydroxymyristoyl)glucosamine N-acyltransferase [Bacteroidales bacterium]
MEFTVKQIADFLQGEIEGDQELKLNTISKIEEGIPGSLTFLANPAYTPHIYKTKASAAIVNKSFVAEHPVSCTLIRVDNAYNSFAQLLDLYAQSIAPKNGISDLAFIAPSATIGDNAYVGEFTSIGENVKIGKNVKIYPQCYIGDNVTIGDNTYLYPGVKIYHACVIGSNVTLHAGVVIGGDGFGFAPQDDKNYKKVAQIGNVVIEDWVEIGANTTVDRATLGSTIIRKGVKLDNLIQVAHNVEIGENTVIAAQTGIAGSAKVGRNCMIGGQVGIAGHLSIGNEVKIAAQSGLSGHAKDEELLMGAPAFDVSKYRKAYVHFRNLDKLVQRIDYLEKRLKTLENESEK